MFPPHHLRARCNDHGMEMPVPPDRAIPTGLADRRLTEPHHARLPSTDPSYALILSEHEAALGRGDPGYLDPVTGLYVMTAAVHVERGFCCDRGCRHCPYLA